MQRVTGYGRELEGDGVARARARIAATGFPTATAYIESFAHASLLELAEELNRSDADSDPLPISAEHLATLWRDEARATGPAAIERQARRALVGELHRHMPTGWPESTSGDDAHLVVRTMATWRSIVGRDLKPRADEVLAALNDAPPPARWLPANAEDPLLVAAFEAWRKTI